MRKNNDLYLCRICGAVQLDAPRGYDGESQISDICDCSGVEFGYEDTPLQGVKKYRGKWLEGGVRWSNKNPSLIIGLWKSRYPRFHSDTYKPFNSHD